MTEHGARGATGAGGFDRDLALGLVWDAITSCDPARLVRDALASRGGSGHRRLGLAIGKAAVAMARGAGPVDAGVVVAPVSGDVPTGWSVVVASHPFPDERSVAAARAARALVTGAREDDQVLALISGGASSLIEDPAPGGSLSELVARTREAMTAGAPIAALNRLRASLSAVKAGGLVRGCRAPVVTLAISDVIGDDLSVIGSGPTIDPRRADDEAYVIAPMRAFAEAIANHARARGISIHVDAAPVDGDVTDVAADILSRATEAIRVAWGEPTLRLPHAHGEGGRAQQLALILARGFADTDRAALVFGTDGVDGPLPRVRAAAAGAFVDGTTWQRISRAGIDPSDALARCDAGTALAAVEALVVTGPTGINHADVILVGRRRVPGHQASHVP